MPKRKAGELVEDAQNGHARLAGTGGLRTAAGAEAAAQDPLSKFRPLDIRPLRAYRPPNARVAEISCPAYNFMGFTEAKVAAKEQPDSFLHVARPEVDIECYIGFGNNSQLDNHERNEQLQAELDARVAIAIEDLAAVHARRELRRFAQRGLLVRDAQPAVYVYRYNQRMGVVALLSTAAYRQRLLRHEETLPEKEHAVQRFVDLVDANLDPVLVFFKGTEPLNETLHTLTKSAPTQQFYDERGHHHEVWAVSADTPGGALDRLLGQMRALPCMYIADGHHRAAAAVRLAQERRDLCSGVFGVPHLGGLTDGAATKPLEQVLGADKYTPYEYVMVAMFPHDQVQLFEYNRICADLRGHTPEQFIALLEKLGMKVVRALDGNVAKPGRRGCMAMYLAGQWYHVEATSELLAARSGDPVSRLDVSLLNEVVLQPLLGIDPKHASDRLDYVGGPLGLEQLVQTCEKRGWPLAFALYPVQVEDFMEAVNQGHLMPPKSTWFEPKVRPGLFTRLLLD